MWLRGVTAMCVSMTKQQRRHIIDDDDDTQQRQMSQQQLLQSFSSNAQHLRHRQRVAFVCVLVRVKFCICSQSCLISRAIDKCFRSIAFRMSVSELQHEWVKGGMTTAVAPRHAHTYATGAVMLIIAHIHISLSACLCVRVGCCCLLVGVACLRATSHLHASLISCIVSQHWRLQCCLPRFLLLAAVVVVVKTSLSSSSSCLRCMQCNVYASLGFDLPHQLCGIFLATKFAFFLDLHSKGARPVARALS